MLSHLNVLVDLGVEEDEHAEGDDAKDDEAAPVVVVRGVVGVLPEFADLKQSDNR